jgi:hypothetical protein
VRFRFTGKVGVLESPIFSVSPTSGVLLVMSSMRGKRRPLAFRGSWRKLTRARFGPGSWSRELRDGGQRCLTILREAL